MDILHDMNEDTAWDAYIPCLCSWVLSSDLASNDSNFPLMCTWEATVDDLSDSIMAPMQETQIEVQTPGFGQAQLLLL